METMPDQSQEEIILKTEVEGDIAPHFHDTVSCFGHFWSNEIQIMLT